MKTHFAELGSIVWSSVGLCEFPFLLVSLSVHHWVTWKWVEKVLIWPCGDLLSHSSPQLFSYLESFSPWSQPVLISMLLHIDLSTGIPFWGSDLWWRPVCHLKPSSRRVGCIFLCLTAPPIFLLWLFIQLYIRCLLVSLTRRDSLGKGVVDYFLLHLQSPADALGRVDPEDPFAGWRHKWVHELLRQYSDQVIDSGQLLLWWPLRHFYFLPWKLSRELVLFGWLRNA